MISCLIIFHHVTFIARDLTDVSLCYWEGRVIEAFPEPAEPIIFRFDCAPAFTNHLPFQTRGSWIMDHRNTTSRQILIWSILCVYYVILWCMMQTMVSQRSSKPWTRSASAPNSLRLDSLSFQTQRCSILTRALVYLRNVANMYLEY